MALLAMALTVPEATAQRRRRGKRARPAPAAAPVSGAADAPESASDTEAAQPAADAEQAAPQTTITPATEQGAAAPPAEPGGPAEVSSERSAAPENAAGDAGDDPELVALRQEFADVMDRLVQTRARVAMLGKSLFKTRVRVELRNDAAPDPIASRIVVELDGAAVFSGDGSALDADGYRNLFEGFAAPGPHVLTLKLEQQARDDDTYRYRLADSFHVTVPRQRLTVLTLVLDDDSDMADDFPDDQSGEYEVQTRLKVHAYELGED